MFVKEGIAADSENKEALFRLLRFETRNGKTKEYKSLDDYIAQMQPNQEKIYFVVNPSFELAINSPFMEPFKGTKLDVLVLVNNVDEILFQQNGDYKGKRFVNIESSYEEIAKDIGKGHEDEVASRARIPEEDVTPFCLWIKNELTNVIGKVQISKRLKETPAILTGQMSSSMRLMMQMMEQSGSGMNPQDLSQIAAEQTLELNTSHPIVVNLNTLRKKNKTAASLALRNIIDNVMISSGIPYDVHKGAERQFKLINSYLELALNHEDGSPRKIEAASSNPAGAQKTASALDQAKEMKGKPDEKIVAGEHIVSDKDLKN